MISKTFSNFERDGEASGFLHEAKHAEYIQIPGFKVNMVNHSKPTAQKTIVRSVLDSLMTLVSCLHGTT